METSGKRVTALTVRTKLTIVFGLLTVLVAAVAGVSLRSLNAEHEGFTHYVNVIEARSATAEAIRTAVGARAIAARDLVLLTSEQDIAVERRAVSQAHEDVQSHLAMLTRSVASSDASDKGRALVADISRIEAAYGPVALGIVDLALAGRRGEATAMIADQCRPLLAALVKATDAYVAYARDQGNHMIAASDAAFATQRNLMVGLCLFALLVAVCAGVWITRGLMRALGAEPAVLARISQRVAQGDLSPVAGGAQAPADSVLASMAGMQRSLLDLIGQVRLASDNVASGASQIAAGNADLSHRTEEQAIALQDTAASLETLSATVRQNADTAHEATLLAAQASAVADNGRGTVLDVAQRMTRISESSTRIADITAIIEGIAFQTNILALNAAVEAARAGEQGRGFAVVASEVRSLAQRSSTAAKDIKTLIAASIEQIHDGSTLATQAGATMDDVTAAVQRVTALIDNMASASAEQSGDIERVSQSMGELDSATQQNAALVEEAAAAASSLEDQGRRLNQSVALFHWRNDASAMATDTRAPRTALVIAPA